MKKKKIFISIDYSKSISLEKYIFEIFIWFLYKINQIFQVENVFEKFTLITYI